jgi:hypothetical protein
MSPLGRKAELLLLALEDHGIRWRGGGNLPEGIAPGLGADVAEQRSLLRLGELAAVTHHALLGKAVTDALANFLVGGAVHPDGIDQVWRIAADEIGPVTPGAKFLGDARGRTRGGLPGNL